MTLEEIGTSAFTCETVVHMAVCSPELSPTIHAAVTAKSGGEKERSQQVTVS